MIITFTDPDPRPGDKPMSHDLRESALLLVNLECNTVTTLTDNPVGEVPAASYMGTLERRLWAARLRYWAEQFEQAETP